MADVTQPGNPGTLSKSPVVNAASGIDPKSAQQAMTPAAKQGRGEGEYTSVRGNIHQAPSAEPADKVPAVDLMKPVPAVTEEERKRTERQFTQTDVVDPALQAAIMGVKDDPKLTQLGASGAAIQSLLTKNIVELYNQKTSGVTLPTEGTAATGILEALTITGLTSADAETAKTVTGLVNQLATVKDDAGRADIVGKIAKAMGKVDPVTGAVTSITMDDLSKIYKDSDTALGEVIAKGMADHVVVDDKLLASMGYDTPQELSDVRDLLGITANTTLADFQKRAQQYIDNRITPIDKQFERMNDPLASKSEREEALENLRDMGYTGTLASRQTLNKLAGDIEAAGTNITIGDKTFDTVDELLSDDGVTALVAGYLDGTIKADQLPAALVDVIDKNQDAFEAITGELKTEIKEFGDTQEQAKAMLTGVDPETAKLLLPGYADAMKTGYFKTVPTPPTTGIGKVIFSKDVPVAQRTAAIGVAQSIGAMTFADTALTPAAILSNMSDADIKTLTTDTTARNEFIAGLEFGNNIDKIVAAPKYANALNSKDVGLITDVIEEVFGISDITEVVNLAMDAIKHPAVYGSGVEGTASNFMAILDGLYKDGNTLGDVISAFDKLGSTINVGSVRSSPSGFSAFKDKLKTFTDSAKYVSGALAAGKIATTQLAADAAAATARGAEVSSGGAVIVEGPGGGAPVSPDFAAAAEADDAAWAAAASKYIGPDQIKAKLELRRRQRESGVPVQSYGIEY